MSSDYGSDFESDEESSAVYPKNPADEEPDCEKPECDGMEVKKPFVFRLQELQRIHAVRQPRARVLPQRKQHEDKAVLRIRQYMAKQAEQERLSEENQMRLAEEKRRATVELYKASEFEPLTPLERYKETLRREKMRRRRELQQRESFRWYKARGDGTLAYNCDTAKAIVQEKEKQKREEEKRAAEKLIQLHTRRQKVLEEAKEIACRSSCRYAPGSFILKQQVYHHRPQPSSNVAWKPGPYQNPAVIMQSKTRPVRPFSLIV